ncbi:ASPIC/UnbV domain-containing protein, partial [Marinicella sediminis]
RQGYWGWGACLADFNNDGHLDIYHENGFNNETLAGDFHDDPARFFVADGNQGFTESSASAGLTFTGQGRGISCVDYDLDGDLDILIIPNNEAYRLYENTTSNSHHYLQVNLFDSAPNPFALGSKIKLNTPGMSQLREVSSANNYVSNNPLQQHFGLGNTTQIDSLEVTWPNGPTHIINSQLSADTNISVGRFCHTRFLSRIIDPEQDNTLALYLHQADGSPLTGTQVQLTVFKGPGTGTVLNGTSDGSGQVSFQLSHSVNGTDRLRYEFTHNNQPHRCLALARWEVDIIFADGFGD